MIGVYSILLGATIVVGALFLLRREFKQAYFIGPKIEKESIDINNQESVLDSIDKIEQGFGEMSEAFYDISGDLEGKYSVHEKELSLIEERVIVLEKMVKDQDKCIRSYQKQLEKLSNKLSREKTEIEESSFDLEKRIEYRGQALKEEVQVISKSNEEKSTEFVDVRQEANEPEVTDTKGQIIALRSKGYSLKQIAKELDIGLGEIQLILNMKR